MFSSVLVANRGEIAVRVITTLRRLGIRAIAVCSEADAGAPHVRLADSAITIGPAAPRESYLDADRIVAAALRSGAQAVHPGYGFLSEQAAFARACAEANLTFIGPPPEALEVLGDKARAKSLAREAGLATVPGIARTGLGLSDEEIAAWAHESADHLPLLVKASAGGGGRGMRVVATLDELPAALQAARREALAGFGDDALLAERYVQRARHIEVQLLADAHGAVVHLGERECSLQRRHQKLIEECPSPVIGAQQRARMGEAAVALARAAGYAGVGTCEFLVPADDPESFWFLELNARLQVEHPVTELAYGIDLVEAQLRVAAGEPLWLAQADLVPRGHAIEARVCSEGPRYEPRTGRIVVCREPAGPGIRVDSGVRAGSEVSAHYDSLLAKVVAHAATRELAIERLDGALAAFTVLGPQVNIPLLRELLADPRVRAGELDTGLVERLPADAGDPVREQEALVAAALARAHALRAAAGDDPWEQLAGWRADGEAPLRWRLQSQDGGEVVEVRVTAGTVQVGVASRAARVEAAGAAQLAITIDGERRAWAFAQDGDVTRVGREGYAWGFREEGMAAGEQRHDGGGALAAPMPGSVLLVHAREGDAVRAGDVLVVLESMKMELQVVAQATGTVAHVDVAPGDRVATGQVLVTLAAPAEDDPAGTEPAPARTSQAAVAAAEGAPAWTETDA